MRRRGLILLALAGVLLTACGGEDAAQKPAPGTPQNPLQALPNPTGTRVPPTSEVAIEKDRASTTGQAAESRSEAVVREQKRVQERNERARAKRRVAKAGRSSAGRTVAAMRGQKSPGPSASRPCSLVSKTQARAIIGAAILEPVEAPQGPTCIYQTKSGRPYITLAIERTSYARLQDQISKRRNIAVADRRGVCGTLGRPVLYVPFGSRRVLSVAGPCALATRFAARAIAHL